VSGNIGASPPRLVTLPVMRRLSLPAHARKALLRHLTSRLGAYFFVSVQAPKLATQRRCDFLATQQIYYWLVRERPTFATLTQSNH